MAEPAHKFYMERHANGPSRYIGAPSKQINKNQPNSALHPSHDDPKKKQNIKMDLHDIQNEGKKRNNMSVFGHAASSIGHEGGFTIPHNSR